MPHDLAHVLAQRLDVARVDLVQVVVALAALARRVVAPDEERLAQLGGGRLVLLRQVGVQQRAALGELDGLLIKIQSEKLF